MRERKGLVAGGGGETGMFALHLALETIWMLSSERVKRIDIVKMPTHIVCLKLHQVAPGQKKERTMFGQIERESGSESERTEPF